ARGCDGGRRVARRADVAQLLPVGDDRRDARGDEHAREAPGQEGRQQIMRGEFRRGSSVNACKTLVGPKDARSATRDSLASRFELPLLGSNQDSPDPESGVLPVTPRGKETVARYTSYVTRKSTPGHLRQRVTCDLQRAKWS